MSNFVPAEINNPAPGGVLIVGRDPGEEEDAAGRPFIGKAGEMLDEMLSHAGWRRQDVNITNVVPYRPPANNFLAHDMGVVERGRVALRALVERLKPILVIALGNEANFAMLGQDVWPTRGRGIYGAKNIEERRGFFWQTKGTTVLSAIHPAAAGYKEVPGKFLLETDFRRARKFVAGELPFETFPEVRRMGQYGMTSLATLSRSRLVGWDIETKWGTTSILCSGYCGDDLQPYVAVYPKEFHSFGRYILEEPAIAKVGHNGFGFDLPALKMFAQLDVRGYAHDTQLMWASIEPEIAGTEEEEDEGGERRLTRKGLAFLTTMYNMNLPWWKNYPESTEPDYLPRMIELNGRDCYATRILAETMLREIQEKELTAQYEQKIKMIPVLNALHVRGLRVDDQLRQERLELLETRKELATERSKAVALEFIQAKSLDSFTTLVKCRCCGGGKLQAKHCWRCQGFPKQPKLKTDWPQHYIEMAALQLNVKKPTVGDLKKSLPLCERCGGSGKVKKYAYNPLSAKHQAKLFIEALGAPKHTFRGKDTMDEAALKRILKWAQG